MAVKMLWGRGEEGGRRGVGDIQMMDVACQRKRQ